jgi:DNA repair protein RadC
MKIPQAKITWSHHLKASERPRIINSANSAELLRELWEPGTMEYKETFWLLLLNRSNKVIGAYKVSEGGISGTVVDLKIIMQAAILSHASAFVIAHNHPSGNLKPSNEDLIITKRIREAARIMELQLMDHIILTEEGFLSFADEGILSL